MQTHRTLIRPVLLCNTCQLCSQFVHKKLVRKYSLMGNHETTTDTATAPFDEMVCFALYDAARSMNRRYTEFLAPWNLTYPQYLVLIALWTRGALTVGAIAAGLHLDSGTTSPLIRRLEDRGLIIRRRESDDERVVTVQLTPAGVDLRAELADIPRCVAEATGLDSRSGRQVLDLVHGITESLNTLPTTTEK